MKTLKIILAAAFVLVSFAYMSNTDYTEQVIYNMPDSVYEAVVLTLGDGCSDYEIANEYMSKRSYYDSFRE